MVESIITHVFLGSASNTLKMRSQIPALAQRVNRLWTLFQFPYPAGRSFQRAPLRSTHKTPFTKLRLSLAVTPTDPGRPGKNPSILRHWEELSSYRFMQASFFLREAYTLPFPTPDPPLRSETSFSLIVDSP